MIKISKECFITLKFVTCGLHPAFEINFIRMKNFYLTLCVLLMATFSIQAQLSGNWKGEIIISKKKSIVFEATFEKNPALTGNLSIPEQGATGLKLSNIDDADNKAHFEFDAGNSVLVFDGTISGDSASGKYIQGRFESTFTMVKTESKTEKKQNSAFMEEEVSFGHNDVVLSGTLTIPNGKGNFPAVVLVSGSGGQTRDCNIFGFNLFEILADSLTRQGIAVLRYDDRGFGKSTGDFNKSTTTDFSLDAQSAIDFLAKHEKINPKRIFVYGHSEGGVIATRLAANPKNLSGALLIAAPAMRGDSLLLEQTRLIGMGSGLSNEQLEKASVLNRKFYTAVIEGQEWSVLEPELKNFLQEEFGAVPTISESDKNTMLEQKLEGLKAQYQSPWLTEFLRYSPVNDLRKIQIPILAVYGGKDVQVPEKSNRAAMEKLFRQSGKSNAQIKTFEQANHLFQEANSGLPTEYADLNKQYVNGFIMAVSTWILK